MATEDRKDEIPKVGNRRSNKPIMEKRRRARINASLTELKSLLLQVMKQDGNRFNKLEKADILEMTVKYLRTVQRRSFSAAAATDPTVFDKYQVGYSECATEVSRYLGSLDGVNDDLKGRLMGHILENVQGNQEAIPSQHQQPAQRASPMMQGQVPTAVNPQDYQKNITIAPKIATTAGVPTTGQVLSFPGGATTTVPQLQFLQLFQNGSMGFVVPSGVVVTSPATSPVAQQPMQMQHQLSQDNLENTVLRIASPQMQQQQHPACTTSPQTVTVISHPQQQQPSPNTIRCNSRSPPPSRSPSNVSCADRDLNNNVVASELDNVRIMHPKRELVIENSVKPSESCWRPW